LSKYPHTDDDDLGNKDLDTWIPETKLASLMIEPLFPKARCVISGFEGDLEGGASKGGKKMKHLELNKIRIS